MPIDRIKTKAKNRFGTITSDDHKLPGEKSPRDMRFRSARLNNIQSYMESTQYDDKQDWFEAENQAGEHVPLRNRMPFIIIPLPKMHAQRINTKLFGQDVFPEIEAEDNPDLQEYLKNMVYDSDFKIFMKESGMFLLSMGSVFLRFYVDGSGGLGMEVVNPNHCHPVFANDGELESLDIIKVYNDPSDIDPQTRTPKRKWSKTSLGKNVDVLFDNPPYEPGQEPHFEIVDSVEHELGFVQGVWFKTTRDRKKFDGPSMVEDIFDLTDSISYNFSQSDRATEYATDPQTIISGMTEDELGDLVKSKNKAWTLGREGSATFLEQSGSGIQLATEQDSRIRRAAQEITRSIFHDPEKIVGSAQSALAMKVLHAPMVDLIHDLRPIIEPTLKELLSKLYFMSNSYSNGKTGRLEILKISFKWGDVFPPTLQDFRELSTSLVSLVNNNIISRETALRRLSKFSWVGVQDIEEELKKIKTQVNLDQRFMGV